MKYIIHDNFQVLNVVECESTPEELCFEATFENIEMNRNLLNINKFFPIQNSEPILTQYEIDMDRYLKRASAKDKIIAEMASENMARIRSGIWTVQQLIELTQDPILKLVLDDVNTLSFELAYNKLDLVDNPIVTLEIKNNWKLKLSSHFYI